MKKSATAEMQSLARKFTDREVRPLLEEREKKEANLLRELVSKTEELEIDALLLQNLEEALPLCAVWVEELSRACLSLGVLFAAHFRALLPLLQEDGKHFLKAQKSLFATPIAPFVPPGTLSLDRENLKLSGELREEIGGGHIANSFCLSAQSKKGETELVWLPKETAHLTLLIGESRLGLEELCFAKLSLRECSLKEAFCLPLSPAVFEALYLSEGFFVSALLGVSKEARAIAWGYAEKRYQGGELICRHDAIKKIFSEMAMHIALMEASRDQAFHSPSPRNALFTAFAARVTEKICLDAIQVLGGYGYMKDFRLEKILRDSKTLQSLLLTRERLAQDDLEKLQERRKK